MNNNNEITKVLETAYQNIQASGNALKVALAELGASPASAKKPTKKAERIELLRMHDRIIKPSKQCK